MLRAAHIELGDVLHPAGDVVDGDHVGHPVPLQASQEKLLCVRYGTATGRAKKSKAGDETEEMNLSWVYFLLRNLSRISLLFLFSSHITLGCQVPSVR